MDTEHRSGSGSSLPEGDITKEYIVRDCSHGKGEDDACRRLTRRKKTIIIGITILLLAAAGSTGFGIKMAKANAVQQQAEDEAKTTEETTKAEETDKSEEADKAVKMDMAEETEAEVSAAAAAGTQKAVADDKEEITAQNAGTQGEETISGLLWNDDLMEDIRTRIEEAKIEEQEEFNEEDYRELLVTLGMAEDYTSTDPELPDYLVLQHNEKMEMDLTEEELSTLLRLVESEAPSEDIYGKILVANVVLNRVFSEKMADSVTGVIYEKIGGSAQFSPTEISWYWNSIVVTDSTREAVARCLSGEDYSNGALYFYAWERHPEKRYTCDWLQKCEYLFTHGGHIFFR